MVNDDENIGEQRSRSEIARASCLKRAMVQGAIGTAWMEDDGSITLNLKRTADGISADAVFNYKTTDAKYNEVLKHLGGLSPGEFKPVMPWET